MHRFTIETRARTEWIPITRQVQAAVTQLGIRQGTVTVFVPHTTAGVTINENADPDVTADMTGVLERMVPWQGPYRHSEGNTAAHVKASLMGSSVRIIVEDGRLCLGTWQGVYFCEFDGPRSRECWVAAG